jgi:hypothetical protein
VNAQPPVLQIRDANRLLIYRAYDDGDGNTLNLEPSEHQGWFVGTYDEQLLLEATEVDGTLYSICAQSGGGLSAVLVGTEIVDNSAGVIFSTTAEARAYIQGLTAR